SSVYILELNPRASRTVPFLSKVTGVPMVNVATKVMLGKTLKEQGYSTGLWPRQKLVAVKAPVFSMSKLVGVDTHLGPEMKSTGEVMGIDQTFELAFWKAQIAAGQVLPTEGAVFLSAKDRDKDWIVEIAKEFNDLGFKLVATEGTAQALHNAGLEVLLTHKLADDGKNVIDLMKESGVQLLVNTPSGPVARIDEIKIRSEAILRGLPIVTTESGTKATVQAIRYIKENDWDVKPIQEYHA
ncbi:MAG: carbamoyl phosphate synthase large subunit, partial [Verrucomicrobia bacterium]|nr:carbamoyl phosphate synthase large subunit [Verrucomicrobiota bacterium]